MSNLKEGPLLAQYQSELKRLLSEARRDGYVFTVSALPRIPLAVGNHDLVIEVRLDRSLTRPN